LDIANTTVPSSATSLPILFAVSVETLDIWPVTVLIASVALIGETMGMEAVVVAVAVAVNVPLAAEMPSIVKWRYVYSSRR
jgi:hypothetical protein